MAQDVSDLLGFYGIKNRIKYKQVYDAKFPNGKKYERNFQRWDVVIDQSFLPHFHSLFTLSNKEKQARIEQAIDNLKRPLLQGAIKIKGVRLTSIKEDVWDINVQDTTHCFQLSNCMTGNCGEIILRNMGFCNLTEVIVRPEDDLKSLKRKVRLATILGTLQSTLTDFRYLRAGWKKNAEEERLLGVSLTGIMDNPITANPKPKLLQSLKQVALDTNKEWANKLSIEPSAAITCVKPSGTVSQLVNSASGIHPRYDHYYIRAIRQDKRDPIASLMKECHVPSESDITKPNDVDIFYFPVKTPATSRTRHEIDALAQLEVYLRYRKYWCEHNPSCTVYVKDSEWLAVAAWVYSHFNDIGGISFLPYNDHIYKQAPYNAITKEEYEKAVANFPVIDWGRLSQFEKDDRTEGAKELACTAGYCEL